MSNTIKILFLVLGLIFCLASGASAQEATEISADVEEAVEADENIQAEDLGISEPRILPDSPFYFLKNWGREIRSFFAFNPITRVELREKFANEKLVELKKMVEEKKSAEMIKKAAEGYQKEVEKTKEAADKIKQKAEENERVGEFLDKFTKQQILHQRILQKLENQVPSEAFEKIKEARERHLESFGEVMNKLEDRTEKVKEVLEKNMEEIKGSIYKNFKNLEILLELEEKVPERAKEAIQSTQENALKRLRGDLEKMSSEDQEKFNEYIREISGEKERHLEILENLRQEVKKIPGIPEAFKLEEILEEGRVKIMEKIEEKTREINCPEIERPAPDFCKEGRIIVKKDEKGCIVSFECLIPGKKEK